METSASLLTASPIFLPSGSTSAVALPASTKTWIEFWPPAVQALSFRQVAVLLTPTQVHALGHRNGVRGHTFKSVGTDELRSLADTLDCALAGFPGGAFVRLGSRSPKDAPFGLMTGCRASSSAQVIRLLTDGSQRVAFDLRLALRYGLAPRIYLREWHDIPWEAEWRCFFHHGGLVGISQYHRRPLSEPDRRRAELARPAIESMAATLHREMGDGPLVFDVFIDTNGVRLIELNPWGEPTDACLFDWQRPFDGTLRML